MASAMLYEQIFDEIPIGLFLINHDNTIHAWNSWMAQNTNIDESIAVGQSLQSLYPDYSFSSRFNWALDQVISFGHPQVLSTILNKFIIPIPINKQTFLDLEMMQQNVEILPVKHQEKNMALIVIKDVSLKTHLENTLMSMATKFEKSSLIDALTGINNRRSLWQDLDNKLKTARNKKSTVVCCIYDLDFFKKINDELGHKAGDEVLVGFTNLVKSLLRKNDSFYRYGGEEFITVTTGVDIKEAALFPNLLRETLAKTTLLNTVDKKITCSGGVAYWQPSDPPISPEKLINQADLELLKAKKRGRNCIVVKE